jgi:predicted nucleic acid-binding protein
VAKRFYLDTSIWRDYFDDRGNGFRPLGEFAFHFLAKCREKNCKIIVSGLVLHELKRFYSEERLNQFFDSFKGLLEFADITPSQLAESKAIAMKKPESHLADILHAIVARDSKAVLVTRDRHFESLRGIAEAVKPEEIIFG